MTTQRIGLLGGTFDPIHIGHLVIADRAREQLDLDQVIFLPAGVPPHKRDEQHTSVRHRLAMLDLAITGRHDFVLSDRDIRPDRPSYTVELLREFRRDHPEKELVFIIGADSLRDFPTWHDPEGIVALARLGVADRPDVDVPPDVFQRVRGLSEALLPVRSPLLDISATELRERIAAGYSVQYLIPDEVMSYIRRHGLYRDPIAEREPR